MLETSCIYPSLSRYFLFFFCELALARSSLLTEMESQQAPIIMAPPRTNEEERPDVYRK